MLTTLEGSHSGTSMLQVWPHMQPVQPYSLHAEHTEVSSFRQIWQKIGIIFFLAVCMLCVSTEPNCERE